MYKKYKILITFSILLAILFPTFTLIAQEENIISKFLIDGQSLDPSGVKKGEVANCFDRYKFDSIGMVLTTNLSTYKPSDLVEISGEISNNNPYPITDLTIRARVLKEHPNPVVKRALYTTLDDFIVLENITLKSNEVYKLDYDYFVPSNATGGIYKIQYYAYNQNRFNLAGLSFTEDIIGGSVGFDVESDFSEYPYLDKTNILVADKYHDTRGFITTHESGKDIPVKIPLVNPMSEDKEILVTYKLYKWDGVNKDNLIEESNKIFNIKRNEKVDLEYIIKSGNETVYYLVMEAKPLSDVGKLDSKEKTMAHIRVGIKDNNKPRINWVGLNKYPFEENDDIELITCVQNTSSLSDNGPVKVESIVKDDKGKELTRIEYQGILPSSISGLVNKFKVKDNINLVRVETSIFNSKNELVDSIITNYDCNLISPESCKKENNNYILALLGVIVTLLIILLFILWNKNYKLKK